MTTAHQLINQDSGNVEWWTPKEIVNVARQLMGGIDLDPACEFGAAAYQGYGPETLCFDKELNGLNQHWANRVWMNHPFGRTENAQWIDKLIASYRFQDVTQACCITFASVSESWCQPLLKYGVQFFFRGRINYIDPTTMRPQKGVTKGSMFTWLFDDKVENYESARLRLQYVMDEAMIVGVAK